MNHDFLFQKINEKRKQMRKIEAFSMIRCPTCLLSITSIYLAERCLNLKPEVNIHLPEVIIIFRAYFTEVFVPGFVWRLLLFPLTHPYVIWLFVFGFSMEQPLIAYS